MSQDITNPAPQDNMLVGLERLARDTSISTDRIEALYRLAERRELALQKRMFNEDMNALQTVLTQIARDKPNPAFNSVYATEEQLDKLARPEYTRLGFSIRFGTMPAEIPGNIRVVCVIAHRGGYFEEHSLEAPAVPANRSVTQLQAVGGCVTYLKRTLIRMVLNLVTYENKEDDDGNGGRGFTDPDANKEPDYLDIVKKFEVAMGRVTDSDEARKLLEWKPGVMALTGLDPVPVERRRYMQLRADLRTKWITEADIQTKAEQDAAKAEAEAQAAHEPLEGL